MSLKSTILIFATLSVCHLTHGQVRQFDKLEMWYSQTLYQKVYRKSNQLLDNPEFDFSMLPKYYKSLSLLQLAQNRYWLTRHPDALQEAQNLFLEVKKSANGNNIFNAHMYELTWLKTDMKSWASDLKRMGFAKEFEAAQRVISVIFDGLQDVDLPGEVIDNEPTSENIAISDTRKAILLSAKQQLGVPYVWAGSTPSGFDCSGFTSFVLKQIGTDLPRRSSDQYDSSTKIKAKNVQAGDLVFFNNGSGVSHVGIIISKKGEPLTMIHSSSSKGIIITEIEKSEYWMKRLHGFGSYVN